MAATSRRIKSNTERISIRSGASENKNTRQPIRSVKNLISSFKISFMVCILGGTAVGLVYLEKRNEHVRHASQAKAHVEVQLQLADNAPAWVNSELKEKVLQAARGNRRDLKIDENAAGLVHQNIINNIAWLDDVKVQATHDTLYIEGRWRKPVGFIKTAGQNFYVDSEQVVLDFIQMPDLPVVEITGILSAEKMPPLGHVLKGNDLAAAIKLLEWLERRDRIEKSRKPLLREIDRIDISNYDGRENKKLPHILLFAKDNTKIIWGAEIGKWQRHLESTDEQKMAKLYNYYNEYGTLSGHAKYINLCDPQDDIPLPIDKY
ncbi:MAG: hypothetical protein JW837_05245 [Sedimentisphaerales bacterium]|nr:hypothetical protein [Sedimentisphaerales bacterium]